VETGNRYAAMHWNGKSWSVVSLGAMSWIPGTHSVWAVGQALPPATATKFQAVILKYGP